MRGRNTENSIVELDHEMAHCQRKRYVIMKFTHNEKHIVFSDIGKGRRRMEVFDEIKVIIAMN